MSSKNLYDRVSPPRATGSVSHVSRGTGSDAQATLLAEVGESLKTAQAILGHSDLKTTPNTYMHVIPDSERRAVERVGELFMHL